MGNIQQPTFNIQCPRGLRSECSTTDGQPNVGLAMNTDKTLKPEAGTLQQMQMLETKRGANHRARQWLSIS